MYLDISTSQTLYCVSETLFIFLIALWELSHPDTQAKMHSLHLQHAGRCSCLSQPSTYSRTRNVALAALPQHSRASQQTSRSHASSFLLGGLAAATVLLSGGAGAGAIAGEINLTADPVVS